MEGFVGKLSMNKPLHMLDGVGAGILKSPGLSDNQQFSERFSNFYLSWLEHPAIGDLSIVSIGGCLICLVGIGYDQGEIIDEGYFKNRQGIIPQIVHLLRFEPDRLPKADFSSLNGSFLILVYAPVENRLIVITDRFASRHFFYQLSDNSVCFSSDLRALLQLSGTNKGIDQRSLVEFLQLSVIGGTRTIYQQIKTLGPASLLIFDGKYTDLYNYWTWKFCYPESKPIDIYAEDLSNAFRQATQRLVEGQENIGLLLTGGLDSRMIAACIAEYGMKVRTITFADFENPETALAKRVAAHFGFEHKTLLRSPQYYSEIVEQSIDISNCLHSFSEAHLIGYQNDIVSLGLSTLVNGWGLDVFFSGSYLPQKHINLFGRQLPLNRMRLIESRNSMIEFLLGILSSPENKNIQLSHDPGFNNLWKDWPNQLIDQSINQITTSDPLDTIDYVLFHAPSKFRSFLFPYSCRPYSKERCILYDNELLDMYFTIPSSLRFNSRVYRKALALIAPQVLSIPYLKTGAPLNASPLYEQWSVFVTPFIRGRGMQIERIFGKHREFPAATYASSYPDLDILVRVVLREKIYKMLSLDAIYDLGLMVQQKVNNVLDDHMSGKNNYGKLLINLCTLASWFDRYGASLN